MLRCSLNSSCCGPVLCTGVCSLTRLVALELEGLKLSGWRTSKPPQVPEPMPQLSRLSRLTAVRLTSADLALRHIRALVATLTQMQSLKEIKVTLACRMRLQPVAGQAWDQLQQLCSATQLSALQRLDFQARSAIELRQT